MKYAKPMAAAAVLAGAAGAHAQQASVTLYGLLDAGVESVSNVGAAGQRLNRLPTNTNSAPSRFGLRGSEDLGGGLKALFTLENGIAPDTGMAGQGGRLFGRQAWVGIGSAYGTFSLGRQYTMTFWSGLDADILGGNIYGTGSLDAYLPNARADNSLAWRGKFGGLSLGATYSLGRDAVNAGPSPAGTNCAGESASDKAACREWSVMAKYDAANWGFAFADDRLYGRAVGAPPDAVFGGMNSSGKTDDRLVANGYVKLAGAKIGGGLIRRKNEGDAVKPNSKLWHAGVSYPATAQLTLDAQVVSLRYSDVSDFNSTLYGVRGLYALSKRTSLFAQVATIRNDKRAAVSVSGGAPGSNPAAGNSQVGLHAGVRHSF